MTNPNNPFENLYAGFILGKEKFIKDTLTVLKDKVEGKDFSRKKIIQSISSEEIIQKVAEYYKEDPETLKKSKNKPLLAKKVAVYLMKRLTSMTNIEIGKEFGVSYAAVSKASKDIENLMQKDRRLKVGVKGIISRFKV